jgi:type II secretory ATPase GspE/PulE/Tfp pilus assembly ATPase PilB-like protein
MILQQAVESGHQIFTTVHATSAFGIIKRLISPQIGLTRDVLAADDFISALVYQRLIPVNCKHCSKPAIEVLSSEILADLETRWQLDVYRMRCASDGGCPHCQTRGYKPDAAVEEGAKLGVSGVTVISEIVVPTDELRELIAEGKDMQAKRMWRGTRRTGFDDSDMTGKTAFEHGIYKASLGIVDIRFVEDAFVALPFYQIQEIKGY